MQNPQGLQIDSAVPEPARSLFWLLASDSWLLLLYVHRKFYGQAERAISNGQLNALLHLHIRPIDVVVFHGPS